MGYGYGVWLIIEDEEWINTTHVPHITVACFMTYQDAYTLYSDILDIMMTSHFQVDVINEIVDFDKGAYPDDDSDLEAWGYNIDCNFWDIFRAISLVYRCNFSYEPHTTVEYNNDPNLFVKRKAPITKLNCKLVVANINSNNPDEWMKI